MTFRSLSVAVFFATLAASTACSSAQPGSAAESTAESPLGGGFAFPNTPDGSPVVRNELASYGSTCLPNWRAWGTWFVAADGIRYWSMKVSVGGIERLAAVSFEAPEYQSCNAQVDEAYAPTVAAALAACGDDLDGSCRETFPGYAEYLAAHYACDAHAYCFLQ